MLSQSTVLVCSEFTILLQLCLSCSSLALPLQFKTHRYIFFHLYNCYIPLYLLQSAAYSVRKLYICACILPTLNSKNKQHRNHYSLENLTSFEKKTEQDYRLAVLKYNKHINTKNTTKLKLEELALNNLKKKKKNPKLAFSAALQ